MMEEKITKLNEEEIEIEHTNIEKSIITKQSLLNKKARIDELLAEFK